MARFIQYASTTWFLHLNLESNTSHSIKGLSPSSSKTPTEKVTRFKPFSVIVQPSECTPAKANFGHIRGTKSAKRNKPLWKDPLRPPPHPSPCPRTFHPFRCPLMHFSDAGREPLLMDEFNGRLGQKGWMKGGF
ncbi:hypothetical protein CEXT_560671 [Caerostris extrusa]|uniref:Uncharacterized protein n=1 Tax=Caerostris extrusa TaxID=172846 RepID=A0AAV4MDX9_CAEEX|nr:hypothetical protein CEXT_560671 [Caerostris extrusa]